MDRQQHPTKPLIALLLLTVFSFILGASSYAFAADTDEESIFLPVDKAFVLTTQIINNHYVELNFKIAPHCLLYRDHFKFKTLDGKTIAIHTDMLPPALIKQDDILHEAHFVYAKQLTFTLPLPQTPGLRVEYQGCIEDGFCYNAIAKEIVFPPQGVPIITVLSPEEFNNETLSSTALAALPSETDRIALSLKSNPIPLTLVLFLGMGILLSFTPCVLPMIPILANILIGEEKMLSTRRALFLTSLYVLSVAICYAIAGALAGIAGNHFQLALQKPIFLTGLSFLLLLFALSQFDLIHIHLPSGFSHTLHQLQRKQKQGSILGAIGMGGISALMMSPCVTPALIGALSYIGQTGKALLGGLALFALALGMGLPLLLVATVGSHLLPKTGRWMSTIKALTGLLLLVLSYSLLDRAFPNQTTPNAFSALAASTSNSEDSFKRALENARQAQQPFIVDVYADWCLSCRQIDREIFNNQHILSALHHTPLLRFDMTHQTPEIAYLQKQFNIMGPPTVLFFDKNGAELKHLRLAGKIKPSDFLKHLESLESTHDK